MGGKGLYVLFLSPFFLPHKKSLAEHGVSLEGITTGTAQRDDKQIQYSSASLLFWVVHGIQRGWGGKACS